MTITTERTPDPAELAAYVDALFQMITQSWAILQDASGRGESQEVVNERTAQMMAALEVDWARVSVVNAYLAAVEDGSPIRPMRHALLRQLLAQMFDDEEAHGHFAT